jgi:Calcineurin-like phosphoesterase
VKQQHWLVTAVFILISFSSLAGNPFNAHYHPDDSELFWFVQLTDPHCGNGDGFDRLMLWQSNYEPIINPVLTIISGDLADNQDFDKDGERWFCDPKSDDWEDYTNAVTLWFDSSQVLDGPGNHDSDDDPTYWWFKNYSVQGTAFDQTQNSVVKDLPFGGSYHFLMCDTSIPGQNCWTLYGELDSTEITFIDNELATFNTCNLQFVFGHHPISGYGLNNIDPDSGGDSLDLALNAHGVSSYGFGHVHTYNPPAWYDDGYLHVVVDSIGKEDSNNVVIYTVDGDGLAIRSFDAYDLPFVMITAPVDRYLGGAVNPYDYDIPKQENCIVRAVAFDEAGAVNSVEFQVDGTGSWISMVEVGDSVWQSNNWDTRSLPAGDHTLTVRCDGTAVRTDSLSVQISDAEPTWTPVPTATPPDTPSPTVTATFSPMPTPSFSPTYTTSPTPTWSPTPTATFTPSPIITSTPVPPTSSSTPSYTPVISPTPAMTSTPTSTLVPTATDTPMVNPTNTPSPTHSPNPSSTPIPTGTPIPSNTPVQTNTPFPSNTPVPTSAPTSTDTPEPHTPSPSATPTDIQTPMPTDTPNDCTTTGATLWMQSDIFHPGDTCSCHVIVCNAEGYGLAEYPLFVILDVYGHLFFAPSYNQTFDYYDLGIIPAGSSRIDVLDEFAWPEDCGSANGIQWYAALTDPAITRLFGELGMWEFGWSE